MFDRASYLTRYNPVASSVHAITFLNFGAHRDWRLPAQPRADVASGVPIALEGRTCEVGRCGQTTLLTVAIYEQPLLHLIQDFELEVLRDFAFEQLEAECIDRKSVV